jgi:hypothetical protein
VRVSRIIEENGGSVYEQWHGLLHDASEAYLGDVVWPLKKSKLMEGYKAIEDNVEMTIATKFGLRWPKPSIIKHADLVILATEKRDLMTDKTTHREAELAKDETGDWHCDHVMPHPVPIVTWSAHDAEQVFLRRFRLLEERRRTG